MELSTKSFKGRYCRWTVVCFLICFLLFNGLVSDVIAGPEGAQVVNGQVSIQQSGSNTAITASDKAIINYSSFNIAQPETVRFIQPGSSASVLNRILSANPTNIDGTLLANGRVFFVNPAGVYIGAGARINVNQLVASGLNISNADFINGRYNFAGGNGAVINSGDIRAERVYLIGRQVANSGNISCPAGYVVMASGDRVFLGEPGSDIVLEVDASSLSEPVDAAGTGTAVLNEGTIDAAGGIIALAAAGDIYSQAISNVGTISASAETGKAGQIKITAADGTVTNTGTIEASGSEGGQVAMEGARVGQFGTVHADGTSGDGGDIDLWASDVVALSSDSLTTANAGTNGDGGEVIVYSPDTALFWPDATIEAKGGTVSGDGGFVEVSGKKHVEVYGSVDAGANNGLAGLLFIDPYNVEITSADAFGSWDGGNPDTFTPTGTGSTILNTTLETNLGAQNVKISTFHGTGVEDGDITINASIDYGGDNYLTLEADDDIIFGASGAITLTGGASDLTLIAGNTTADGGILNDNDRTITMGTGGLRMVADAGIGSSANPILTANLTDVAATTATGGIFINNSTSGNINVTSVGGTNGLTTTTSGNISVTNSAGNIVLAQAITTAGDGTITLNAGTNNIDTADQTIDAGAGTISLTSDAVSLGTTANAIVTTGAVTLQPTTATTAIGIGGAVAAYQLDDAEIAAIQDGTSGITIGRSTGQHAITIDAITFNDPVIIQSPSGGSIAVNGQITGSGNASVTLDGSGATTTLSADIVTAGQDVTISDNVVLDEAHTITLSTGAAIGGNISITGTTSGTAGGVAENLTLISGTGTTTLGGAVGAGGEIGTLILQADNASATGAVTFNGAVTADTITTYGRAYSVAFNAGGTITTDTIFLNTGTVTLGNEDTDSITFTGGLDTTGGPSGTNVAGTVATTNTQMDLGAVTMTANSTLKSGSGAINVASVTDGGSSYSLDAGDGSQTGAITFSGNATINDLDTFASGYNVAFRGASNTIDTDTIFLNTGTVTLGNENTDSIAFTGGLDTTAGSTNIAGTVTTTAQDIDLGTTILTDDSALSTGAGAGNITFQNTLNGTTDFTEDLALTAGTGNIDFDAAVGGVRDLGNVTINSATNVTIDSSFNANNISITSTNTAANNVTAAGGLTLNSTTTVANGSTLRAGTNLNVGAASLTGGGALTLIATGGSISGNGTIQANSGVGTQGDLTLRQGNSLNLANLTFGNQSTTDLTAQSYNGGVTIDKTKPANAADQWQSITAAAQSNVVLLGDNDITTNAMTSTAGNIGIESTAGNLILNGGLTANAGGVSLKSKTGKIYTPGGSDDTLNVPITGYSNSAAGTGVVLPYGSAKAAIVIENGDNLILGPGAALTANGVYNPAAYDDRESVDFDSSLLGGGDRLDVAIYLGNSQVPPVGTITVNSIVQMANNGGMVVDAGEKVLFGDEFSKSVFNQTQRLEVVSRQSETLNVVITNERLPFAEDPEAIRSWFTSPGNFAGAYVLRGVRTLLAEVLALTKPVPLVPPRTLEPELRSEVEGPDTEALAKLLSELGIGVQPYMTDAYAGSLSTDLRLYKAAEKLQVLMPILEDADGTRIAGLKAAVAQFFPTLDVLTEEQVDSFDKVLKSHKGDRTDFGLAEQCINSLREYVNILGTDIGWPAEKSVGFVMGRYVPRLTEGDEVRIAVIQMFLQKEL